MSVMVTLSGRRSPRPPTPPRWRDWKPGASCWTLDDEGEDDHGDGGEDPEDGRDDCHRNPAGEPVVTLSDGVDGQGSTEDGREEEHRQAEDQEPTHNHRHHPQGRG